MFLTQFRNPEFQSPKFLIALTSERQMKSKSLNFAVATQGRIKNIFGLNNVHVFTTLLNKVYFSKK